MNPLQVYATEHGLLDFAAGPPLAELLALCRRSGFGAVQVDHAPGRDAVTVRAALAVEQLRLAPPYFSAPLADPALPSDTEARFDALLGYADALGVDRVVIACDLTAERFHAAGQRAHEPVDERVADLIAGRATSLARRAADHGIVACFHPHVGTDVETPAEITALLARTAGSGLLLCPDTGHLFWGGTEDVRGFLNRHRASIGMLHLKDADRATAATGRERGWHYARCVREGVWREPGDGGLDLAGVLDDWSGADLPCVVEVDAPHAMTAEASLSRGAAFVARWRRGCD